MEYDKKKVISLLNKILEAELAGVVRYTHYSFMVYGYNRIPIVSWLREQATESMGHAQQAGELITSLGEHPSLGIGHLLETQKHDVGDILREALENERNGLQLYRDLLKLCHSEPPGLLSSESPGLLSFRVTWTSVIRVTWTSCHSEPRRRRRIPRTEPVELTHAIQESGAATQIRRAPGQGRDLPRDIRRMESGDR